MVARLWALVTRYGFDAFVVAGIAGGLVEVVVTRGNEDAPDGPLGVLVVGMLALTVPFLFRRLAPFAALAAVFVAGASVSFVEDRLVPYSFVSFIAAMTASFLLGMRPERAQAVAGLALGWAAIAVIVRNDPEGAVGDFFFVAVILTATWIAAFALRRKLAQAEAAEERAGRLEREREERAREAVADERARIARELHDVVAHGVSVMTVQAGAVRRLLRPEQEREREALEVIEQTGREALAEMRRMVGVMKRPEEGPVLAPQPSLEHVGKLVEQAREAGLRVELTVEGEPVPLPAGVELSAYRIVQEGLTNTLKHAHATSVDVLVRYGREVVELVVSDDGRGSRNGDGGGHGLVGMRERVAVYGGQIEAGPKDGGGYELRARLPVGS
jgi:signal transduction histidine kinase